MIFVICRTQINTLTVSKISDLPISCKKTALQNALKLNGRTLYVKMFKPHLKGLNHPYILLWGHYCIWWPLLMIAKKMHHSFGQKCKGLPVTVKVIPAIWGLLHSSWSLWSLNVYSAESFFVRLVIVRMCSVLLSWIFSLTSSSSSSSSRSASSSPPCFLYHTLDFGCWLSGWEYSAERFTEEPSRAQTLLLT